MDRRIAAIIVAAIVVIAGAATYVVLNSGDDGERRPSASAFPESVSEESRVLPTDTASIRTGSQTLLDSLEEAISSGTDDELNAATVAAVDRLAEIIDWCTWSGVYYYMDQESQSETYVAWTELRDWYLDAVQTALHEGLSGDRADLVAAAMDRTFLKASDVEDYIPLGEEALRIKSRETALVTQYDAVVATDYTYTYGGETWTIATASASTTLTSDERSAILRAIYTEQYTDAAEIYIELVGVRNDFAQALGFENYLEYSYDDIYQRGYSFQDIAGTLSAMEAAGSVWSALYKASTTDPDLLRTDLAELNDRGTAWIYSTIGSFFGSIDGTLGDFMVYMVEQNLLYYGTQSTKWAYAEALIQPHSTVLYIGYTDYEMYGTLVHELGHAADFALSPYSISLSYDVAEIQSQGLEALMCIKSAEYLGDLADNYAVLTLLGFSGTLYMGSAVALLETWAYTTEASGTELTVESLCEEYLSHQDPDCPLTTVFDAGLHWATVPHVFSTPCYYASYVTSVLNSLEIFRAADGDLDAGISLYLSILYQDVDGEYAETATACGLTDMTDAEAAAGVLEWLRSYAEGIVGGSARC
ncbi:MAG: hypothetical protein Q4Q58_01780 [Thermoplasmata archaeon]|nr:hypothetical protein [Thermoplasmata archaeon]